jgi:hypothetical protein
MHVDSIVIAPSYAVKEFSRFTDKRALAECNYPTCEQLALVSQRIGATKLPKSCFMDTE